MFGNVDNGSTIAREEIFGPVLSVIPADNEEQAVDIANDTIYGLNASVFTNDLERAYATARRVRSGTVGQNVMRTECSLAFGGFKQSGIGREGGTEGLRRLPRDEGRRPRRNAELGGSCRRSLVASSLPRVFWSTVFDQDGRQHDIQIKQHH